MYKTRRDEYREVAARLEAVERDNRKLKKIVLSVVVLAGAMLLMGQARPNRTIEAEKFILKDATGRPRARLEMDADRPILALLDDRSFPVVSLGAGDSPTLVICGEWPPVGSGGMFTCNQQIQIGRFSKEQFGLALYGKDDQGPLHGLQAGLGVRNDVPSLDLWSKDSTESASLNLDAPGPSLLLSTKGGGSLMASGGGFNLETPRVGEPHKTSVPSIALMGEGGKVLWSAP